MQSKALAEGLFALANETRLDMIRAIAKAGATGVAGHEISERTGMPRTLVSHHLKILVRAGLVTERKAGRTIHHRLDRDAMRKLTSALATTTADLPDVQ
jgi:ArsR family transcriptional regulator, arsenate/arsenite/antimonite-responsive transcriptional repressor